MEYSDLLDSMPRPAKRTLRLDYTLMECRLGEEYEARIRFVPIAMDMMGTTIEVIDFQKTNTVGTQDDSGASQREALKVIPAPS